MGPLLAKAGRGLAVYGLDDRCGLARYREHKMSETKKFKRGDVREDGKVFWRYVVSGCSKGAWLSPEKFRGMKSLSERANRRFNPANRGRGVPRLRLGPDEAVAHHATRLRVWRARRKEKFSSGDGASCYKRGHVRQDGLVFLQRSVCHRGGGCWLTPEEYRRRVQKPKTRRKNDPSYRAKVNLRCRLNNAVKAVGSGKKYPRSADKPAIDWLLWLANRTGVSIKGAHIDHLRPARCFDLTTAEGQRAFNAPENTWWLPAQDNLSKNDADPTPEQLSLHAQLLAKWYQASSSKAPTS